MTKPQLIAISNCISNDLLKSTMERLELSWLHKARLWPIWKLVSTNLLALTNLQASANGFSERQYSRW